MPSDVTGNWTVSRDLPRMGSSHVTGICRRIWAGGGVLRLCWGHSRSFWCGLILSHLAGTSCLLCPIHEHLHIVSEIGPMFADWGGGSRVFIEASLKWPSTFCDVGGCAAFECYLVHHTTLVQLVSFVLGCHQKRCYYSILWFDVGVDAMGSKQSLKRLCHTRSKLKVVWASASRVVSSLYSTSN